MSNSTKGRLGRAVARQLEARCQAARLREIEMLEVGNEEDHTKDKNGNHSESDPSSTISTEREEQARKTCQQGAQHRATVRVRGEDNDAHRTVAALVA